MTVACMLCGWFAFLNRMVDFHTAKAGHPLISDHPSLVLAVFMDGTDAPEPKPGTRSYHRARARDFECAALRPWLAVVHCKPGSLFGAPIQRPPPPPKIKRLAPRDAGSHQADY